MSKRQLQRKALTSFLVATGTSTGQALYNTAGATNHINNTSTGGVRLANGQLGIFSASDFGSVKTNIATDATPTITEAPAIFLAQGTADSANPALSVYAQPLFPRPFESSHIIDKTHRIMATKQVWAAPANDIWVIGNTGAGVAINVADDTEYSLSIGMRGNIIDQMMAGTHNSILYTPSFTTPNYTTLGTTSGLDHLVKNFVFNINRNSVIAGGNQPVVAIALDLNGAVGTAIAGLTAGYLPLITTSAGTRGITLTAATAAMLTAKLPAGSSIVTVDLTTAGAATQCEAFAVMALDRKLAFDDQKPSVKIRLDVGFRMGFAASTQKARVSAAFEGANDGRKLELEYQATQGQRKYNQGHDMNPIINFPSPIVQTENYVRYNLWTESNRQTDSVTNTIKREMTTILIPTAHTTTISEFEGALGSWLTSAGTSLVTL